MDHDEDARQNGLNKQNFPLLFLVLRSSSGSAATHGTEDMLAAHADVQLKGETLEDHDFPSSSAGGTSRVNSYD